MTVTPRTVLAVCLILAGGAALGYLARGLKEGKGEAPAGSEAVTASVRTAPMIQGVLEGQQPAFGSIVPAPGASQTLAVPYESRVLALAVSEGQIVAAGTPLLTLADSPDARLGLDQAAIDAKASAVVLEQARSRHQLKLADNATLAQAQQAADSAQARLASLEGRHLGGNQVLTARLTGVVVRVAVQVGALVPAGSTLMELADLSHLEARLGVEPAAAKGLRSGATVQLAGAAGGGPVPARIRIVSPAINPATRLTDVYLALKDGQPFQLGQFVTAQLPVAARKGWLVPYAAVQPEDGQGILYTVRDGKAVRHQVQVLAQNGDQVQVAGAGLDGAEPLVIQGNYELQDGMAVHTEPRP